MDLQQRELVKMSAASLIASEVLRQSQATGLEKVAKMHPGLIALLATLGVGLGGAAASQISVNGRPAWQTLRDYNQDPEVQERRRVEEMQNSNRRRREAAIEQAQDAILGGLGL